MTRLYNLDYLRGIAAFSIMIYHYCSYSFGNIFDSASLLGRLGTYGVSIFYILSGLTLYLVYEKRFNLLEFCIKRIFRIFPLLWLAIIGTIVVTGYIPNFKGLFLNITGLFGFIKPAAYVGTGMWSIGNELVFYTFFPLFIYLLNKKKLFVLFVSILFFIYLAFAFYFLTPRQTIEDQWAIYVNPLNQIFLFASGIIMGLIFKNTRIKANSFFLILSCFCFIFFPVEGDKIAVLTGWNRLFFTLVTFFICLCSYKNVYELPFSLHKPLQFLGEASYSLYLLHPIIWFSISKIFGTFHIVLPSISMIIIAVSLSLGISYYVYNYFERYFIQLGKSIFNKLQMKVIPVFTKVQVIKR